MLRTIRAETADRQSSSGRGLERHSTAPKGRKKERDAKNKAVCLETIGKAKCEEVGYVFD